MHELVLQKGDSIVIPEHKSKQRLVMDWEQHLGARPKVRYFAELKPLPTEESSDPGPGGRTKSASGAISAGGAKAAWFKDSEGNILALVQPLSAAA